jgi:RsmE family RNA methyltransferase
MDKHLFALFYNNLADLIKNYATNKTCTIVDKDLVHRIALVLRTRPGEQFILFNEHQHIGCTITKVERTIQLKIDSSTKNHPIRPPITCILPLLKREAFQETLYGLTELGVQNIYLVTTEKTQRTWGGQKELERIIRIIHAAAEQSKNFAFPHIEATYTLAECIKKLPNSIANRFFFDPEGDPFRVCMDIHISNSMHEYILMAGPEGDLTNTEKEFLLQHDFKKIALTPTILRAQQAILIATGALRSLLHTPAK